jgi:hypothetical protein
MDIHGHPCLCVVVEVDVEVDVGGLHMSEHPIQSGPYGAPSQTTGLAKTRAVPAPIYPLV